MAIGKAGKGGGFGAGKGGSPNAKKKGPAKPSRQASKPKAMKTRARRKKRS